VKHIDDVAFVDLIPEWLKKCWNKLLILGAVIAIDLVTGLFEAVDEFWAGLSLEQLGFLLACLLIWDLVTEKKKGATERESSSASVH
jgi:cytochrome c oxidase assembly factor CtaG